MMIDYRLGGWVQNGQNIDYVILEQPLTSNNFGLTKLKLQCFNIGKNSILVKVLGDQLVTNIKVYLYTWFLNAPSNKEFSGNT